jgi:hypothetical protein
LVDRTILLQAHPPQALHASVSGPAFARFKLRHWIAVMALLVCVAVLDAVTGYEVSVFLLYTIPVALVAHFVGAGAGVFMSLLSAVAWILADRWSGHRYPHEWILYVNAFNRWCCFLLAVMAVQYIEQRRAMVAARLRAFTGAVPSCANCQRLRGEDGHWRTPAAYLSELGGAEVLSKVCPDCARRGYALAGCRHAASQLNP